MSFAIHAARAWARICWALGPSYLRCSGVGLLLCSARRSGEILTAGRPLRTVSPHRWWLERVMNSIRNALGMRETEIAREPRRPWNPHFYAVFAQVHNTL